MNAETRTTETTLDFQLVEELTSATIARIAGAALLVEECNQGEYGAADGLHAILDNVEAMMRRLNQHTNECESTARSAGMSRAEPAATGFQQEFQDFRQVEQRWPDSMVCSRRRVLAARGIINGVMCDADAKGMDLPEDVAAALWLARDTLDEAQDFKAIGN